MNLSVSTSSDNRWEINLDSGRHWQDGLTKWNCGFWEGNSLSWRGINNTQQRFSHHQTLC